MKELFDDVSRRGSRMVTRRYSTSFSLGIRFLAPDMRDPICAIYAFVRLADEIVDSFHGYDQDRMLDELEHDVYVAIDRGISTHPILHAFQEVVNRYGIDKECIDAFLMSMRMDLSPRQYERVEFDRYVLGSAEVVGLMCLRVFLRGDEEAYQTLKPSAMKLGAAFQKINFLRDLRNDYDLLNRRYFPGVDPAEFDDAEKRIIEREIESDFAEGYEGIKRLPRDARFGVYVAYVLYYRLFLKIKTTKARGVMSGRMRISNKHKVLLFCKSYVRHVFNLL